MESNHQSAGATTTIQREPTEQNIIKFEVKPYRNVDWQEDVIDNEHLNKKKSKICCIYSKPNKHPDEESSSSSCESSEDERNAYDRPPKHMRCKDHNH